ncbi:hypothetical protein COCC4DRAFT_31414 [Bipolaris maydis ATCC 48331]|uniref:Uncharacterized protein n=2 Tax=Cochliobolus heterostrophus TaxID=5016 RepID=M2UHT5_COCH5|nr:uncharacterized protein COCC4DRAFT_31414 [Bipolaris maydis ATCC 48331]EMD87558.1 hypothetical protein COCHEDRAFT_1023609 [Bipolaris maydis C5]ENI06759.1 hypothetical protein COCC4DRAFT_31414 [Bipolaris maydis ATCC 48331]
MTQTPQIIIQRKFRESCVRAMKPHLYTPFITLRGGISQIDIPSKSLLFVKQSPTVCAQRGKSWMQS